MNLLSRHQNLPQHLLCLGVSLILFIVGILSLPQTGAAATLQTPAVQIAEAAPKEIFRNAYDHRYTWDSDFPGYRSEVSLRFNQDLFHGIVKVLPDLSVQVAGINSVTDIDNEAVTQLVKNQVQMEVIHRRSVPFEQLHGQNSFQSTGTDETGAIKIQEVGDQMDSHFKVRGQKIIQVNRVMGDVAVTVDALGFVRPPEGYLTAHFLTTLRDPKTSQVLEKQDVRDSHTKVGKYYILTNRSIRTIQPGQSDADRGDDILIWFDNPSPL